MIPESPSNPRAELEARVTALLLGELTPEEAAGVHAELARDAELARFEQRLRATLGLVREMAAEPSLKLDPARREKVLTRFKTVELELEPERSMVGRLAFWLVAVACCLMLASMLLPALAKAKNKSPRIMMVNNLRQLETAKKIWQEDNSNRPNPTMQDLQNYGGSVRPLGSESYHLGLGGEPSFVASNGNVLAYTRPDGSVEMERKPESVRYFLQRFASNRAVGAFGGGVVQGIRVAAPPPAFDSLPENDRSLSANNNGITTNEIAANSAVNRGNLADGSLRDKEKVTTLSGREQPRPNSSLEDVPEAGKSVFNAPVASSGGPAGTVFNNGQIGVQGGTAPDPTRERRQKTEDQALTHAAPPPPVPQPEVLTRENAFTTFSLNISDAAFKLTQASLQNGTLPEPVSLRAEEFINAFDYRDPAPAPGAPIGFAWDRAADPFAQQRDFVRFSIQTAAQGRAAGRPLNLVLVLDKSGSMERADRVNIIAQALRVLAGELQPGDTLSVVVFARTARLFADGVSGRQMESIAKKLRDLTPEGGTNIEEAMKLACATARRHYLAGGENHIVLLTDGAANLGDTDPEALKRLVKTNRTQGMAFDCFGVGWEDYNDSLLEELSHAGGGRYAFLNTPEAAGTEFAGKLAGALRVAAADVKVQVEFNPKRVTAFRQIGYAKDQLQKEDFHNDAVKAAEIGAAEAGTALYTVRIDPNGEGDLGTVHVRYRVPGTSNYEEHAWPLPYTGAATSLDQSSPAMRLCAVAAEFCEWLSNNPHAGGVTPNRLLELLRGVPQAYGADTRPADLETMIHQAKSISGK